MKDEKKEVDEELDVSINNNARDSVRSNLSCYSEFDAKMINFDKPNKQVL